jgi:hypothetical protein
MKFLMSLLVIVSFYQSADAADVKLNDGDSYLSPVQTLEVVEVRPLCPEFATCVTDGTVVTVDLGFLGCFDRLAPVYHYVKFDEETNTINLYIGASIIRNKKSMAAFCTKLPPALKTFSLIMMFGEVKVHLLQGI